MRMEARDRHEDGRAVGDSGRAGTVTAVNRRSLTAPAAVTAGLLIPLAALDRRMRATGGTGIIAFELAGPGRSTEILRAWGTEGQRAARASLLLDFPFLVAYTVLNLRLTGRTSDAMPACGAGRLKAVAPVIMAVQVAAGACDAVENAALLGVVARGGDVRLSALARNAARAKFACLTAGWLYGAAAVLGSRSLGRAPRPARPGQPSE